MKYSGMLGSISMSMMIAINFFFIEVALADDNLLVEFNYKGTPYSIQGRQLKDDTFLFNEGAEKKIQITTLDWPPYIARDICKQGWVQQLTIALLASQGYEIRSTFYSWSRTIFEAEKGRVDILYPEYFIEPAAQSDVIKGTKRLDHLALSEKFPGGPIAFMKRKGEPDSYQGDFNNLKGEKIGVVEGYQNTPEFDRLMEQGFFMIDEAMSDVINVRKLVGKRTNLIIGDPAVIRFSAANDDTFSPEERTLVLSSIEMVKPVIQYNHLYYAISKKRPQWQETLDMLNRTLAEFETSGELVRIITATNDACDFEMETLDE